jgi:hypothetical protein
MSWIKKGNIATRDFDYHLKMTWGESRVDEEKMIIYHRKKNFDERSCCFLDIIAKDTENHLFIQRYGNKWGVQKNGVKENTTSTEKRDKNYRNLFGEDSLFPDEYTFIQNKYDHLYQIVIPEERWFEEVHPRFATGVAWMSIEEACEKLDLNSRTRRNYRKLLSKRS